LSGIKHKITGSGITDDMVQSIILKTI